MTGANVPAGFSERFIHSEVGCPCLPPTAPPLTPHSEQIYKEFPDVLSVIHAHTTEVLPFGIAGVPLTAQMNTAASLGSAGTPVFDTAALPLSILPANQVHDLLVKNAALGHALAEKFAANSSVVLMRGHGMAVRSEVSVRSAVLRAFYTKEDATVQLQAAMLGSRHLTPLSMREAQDATVTFDGL